MNKKGVFFTLIAITLISFFLITYSIYSFSDKRIETMNNFVLSVENDLPRKMFISGFRVVFVMEDYITTKGQYIGDTDFTIQESGNNQLSGFTGTFGEVFFDGNLGTENYELMLGATFNDINNSINVNALPLNIQVAFENPSIIVRQDDPWNVNFSLDADLVIKDLSGLVNWNRHIVIDSYIPVDNFDDPIYLIETNGLVSIEINQTPYNPINSGNLLAHAQGPYYIESSEAPNFIQRLQGDITEIDDYGIESIVNIPQLTAQGISINGGSIVDHLYFGSGSGGSQVGGMPGWFILDSGHTGTYGV
jgi:hypothetical protein